jgi:hypothetical protein
MVTVAVVVFLGVFALAFPLAMARGGKGSSPSKQNPKTLNSTNPTGKAESPGQSQEFRKKVLLEHFLFYCRPLRANLNHAFALSGVMHGRASVMA